MEVKAVWTRIQDNTPSADGSGSSGSSSNSYDQMDALTRLYMGGQYGSNAVWIQRADETWTAAINGETPKAKWACLRKP